MAMGVKTRRRKERAAALQAGCLEPHDELTRIRPGRPSNSGDYDPGTIMVGSGDAVYQVDEDGGWQRRRDLRGENIRRELERRKAAEPAASDGA